MAEGRRIKSIVVDNKSAYAVTLHIFKNWTKSRSLAESIIVDRDDSFLFQKEEAFRFELGARLDGKKMETVLSPRMWEKDMMLYISGDLYLKVEEKEMKMEGVSCAPGGLTENMIEVSGKEALTGLETFTNVVEEQLNDDIENKSVVSHLECGQNKAAIAIARNSGIGCEEGKVTEMNDESDNEDIQDEAIVECDEEANYETKKDTRHTKPFARNLEDTAGKDGIGKTIDNTDYTDDDKNSNNEAEDNCDEENIETLKSATTNSKDASATKGINTARDNEEKTEGKHLKSILIDNKSAHVVTLYTLKNWTKSRSLAESRIIDRGDSFLFQEEEAFRFELRARLDGKKMETILSPRIWRKDMTLCISGDRELKIKDEEMNLKEKQICTRRQNMKKEVSASGNKSLYQVLGLNMKEVRMNPFKEQNDIIKKAYHSQLRRWHPDRNPENGDNAICQEIILAYNILKDPSTRAAYNNIADFDEGGLSKLKALFKPKSYRPGRARPFKRRWNRKRVGLSILSVLFVAGGAGLTFLTAGMAAPAVIGIITASGSLMGGGISSGLRTITRQSMEDGCSFPKYLISLLVGAVGGAAIGAGIVGIAGVLGGVAKAAFKAAQLSLDRQISQRMITTAFRGFVTSITNNLDAILAGGPKTTWKQFILHILLDALLGGIAGAPGGLTENMIEDMVSAEEALTAFESFSSDVRNGVEELTTITMETFTTVVEERLNNDIENKSIVSHLKCGVKQVAIAVGKYSAIAAANAAKKSCEGGKATDMNDESNIQDKYYNEIIESSTPVVKLPQNNNECMKASHDVSEESENSTNEEECGENIDNQTVKCFGQSYVSEGSWFSKMLVEYDENGETEHKEGQGSGSLIWIPNNATNIKVKFQVMRSPGIWSDVKKYNFADDHWEKPIQPHIFTYNKPVSLTYTLAGKLCYERVMKVSVECYANIIGKVLPSYDSLIAQTNYEVTSNDDSKKTLLSPEEKTSNDDSMKQNVLFPEEKTSNDDSMKQNVLFPEEKTSNDGSTKQNLFFSEEKTSNDDPMKQYLLSPEEKTSEDGPMKQKLLSHEEKTSNNNTLTRPVKLKYISKGNWFSKMLVDYEDDGEEKHHEVKGSGNSILIPTNAINIKVRFQVMRSPGIWSDVKEYDRFKKCWIKPIRPHIFKYDTPESCTYTLGGNLYYEAVMKTSKDLFTNEQFKLNYISEGNWSSKMIVEYEENGEEKHHEGRGSGSSILLPKNATKIKVRFQVKCGPGVWSDVKEYDRFKKCWIKPTQAHIFNYDTPVSCTYTLTGSLYYAAVTNITGDDDIDARIRLKYLSEENWFSKMLVDYEENGELKHHEGHGSGSLILLPNDAINIKVRFQAMRSPGIWSDVKEYDRFKKFWIKPTRSHVFEYDTPVSCTYILAGSLYYEKVKRTSIDDDDDDREKKLTYICKQSWFSKMLVDYEEDDEEKHHEGRGSGSLILLPNDAINIKVRFQVQRGPGIWCDVKEYDRFKNCWIKPTRPHIFKYDTPVSCTYTLAGSLYYEAVMKVSGDDDIDELIGLKFISEGSWFSKMLIDYEENGEKKNHEGHGSESLIWIPNNATNIKVRFQVMDVDSSDTWCDVKEYDHLQKCWVEPTRPHIFEYDTPVSCTYTLAGNTQCNAVVKISGVDDINERVRLKYISEGAWFSKMLADYEENGETKHQEVKDSESLILIPSKATNINVRFQVMRGPGIWCDVKKYDRFNKCWIKPKKPHIFAYNKAVSRTYTLAGNLYFEKVMKITGEHFDEISDIDDKAEENDSSDK